MLFLRGHLIIFNGLLLLRYWRSVFWTWHNHDSTHPSKALRRARCQFSSTHLSMTISASISELFSLDSPQNIMLVKYSPTPISKSRHNVHLSLSSPNNNNTMLWTRSSIAARPHPVLWLACFGFPLFLESRLFRNLVRCLSCVVRTAPSPASRVFSAFRPASCLPS